MSQSSYLSKRLFRAFSRSGIDLRYENGVYLARNERADATILLPPNLPLEEKAVRQLLEFASVADPQGHSLVCKACATPDFHPGAVAPVGSVVATPDDVVIPAAIGTDVNCACRLMTTGFTLAQLAPHKERLVARLKAALLENERDVPVHTRAFKALFDEGPAAFLDSLAPLGLWASVDRERLRRELAQCVALDSFQGHSRHAPDAFVGSRELFRDPCLGSTGSGNHFVSLEVVSDVLDRHAAYHAGLRLDEVVVMIHSGSRDLGFYVGQQWMDRAKAAWPYGVKHPQSKLYALQGGLAAEYLQAMGVAARYAWANRVVLGELVRKELAQLLGDSDTRLVVDVPHNVVLQENGLNIHRKGATPAHLGDFALIPGSMGDASYLVKGLGNPDWLQSCSHGAGRRIRRQEARALKPRHATPQQWQCVTLREERLIEEGPEAYKPIGPVVDAQEEAGLIEPVVKVRPWVTFKA